MSEIGICSTHKQLSDKLIDYIKTQYMGESPLLLSVADRLLYEKEKLFQYPYVEAAKSYQTSENGFDDAILDDRTKEYLRQLSDKELGVFSTPYVHQIKAVEEFFSGHDVFVTSGTGSGKTECFMWPMFIQIMQEACENRTTWKREGIRTLILYPMNALVSDQLSRIRKIIGRKDDVFYDLLCKNSGGKVRRPRFGMYTSRTPYAGEDLENRNKSLAKTLEAAYLNGSEKLRSQLEDIGRLPAKDIGKFIDGLRNHEQRTDPDDAELLTRFEMQQFCPDILITNYSMLEYMLLRPIEQSIWEKTSDWLASNCKNRLQLVIDEAHMYRGASGGEVSLLIRRLMDKLNIQREQLHCILTTASTPKGADMELQAFANGLTAAGRANPFSIIHELCEEVSGNVQGTLRDAETLNSIKLEKLQSGSEMQKRQEIEKLADVYALDKAGIDHLSSWLYEYMRNYPPMLELIKYCSGEAREINSIASNVFDPEIDTKSASYAAEILLQLGIMAKSQGGKVLLPSKVHMMFRGLNSLFACVNPNCPEKSEAFGVRLGHLSENNEETCICCGGRVFELAMDRRCGTLFLRAYIRNNGSGIKRFLWEEPSQIADSLSEIHLWLMPEGREKDFFKFENSKAKKESLIGYLDCMTGLLFYDASHRSDDGYVRVLIPTMKEEKAYTFPSCPNCGKPKLNVTSFKTKGNEPFANVVTAQFHAQKPFDLKLKNEGKKVLLFSDSRQRAATLARDITIAADGDAGRQALFLAQRILNEKYGHEVVPLTMLYGAFLKVVADNDLMFFYGEEKEKFKKDIRKFKTNYLDTESIRYTGNLMRWDPPQMFYQLLLKNISNTYRSFNNIGLGQVKLVHSDLDERIEENEILENLLSRLNSKTGLPVEALRTIYNAWIQHLIVSDIAIFPLISDKLRSSILNYDKQEFGLRENGKMPTYLRTLILSNLDGDLNSIEMIEREFFDNLTNTSSMEQHHNRRYLDPSHLTLTTNESESWHRCNRCSGLSTFTLFGHCIYCGREEYLTKETEKDLHRYALWREPVIAALAGTSIKNLTVEEHTAQLSHKEMNEKAWITTEKHELGFRNILLSEEDEPVDMLSCTTTMEVGIDIGSLTAVGLRNVPPMRENYQQRAGRAGRRGAEISTIVTYTENGPHDSWYFEDPERIIKGIPKMLWIDADNNKLTYRHLNLILLQQYLRENEESLDQYQTTDFFGNGILNFEQFYQWLKTKTPLEEKRARILIPLHSDFDWKKYQEHLIGEISRVYELVSNSRAKYIPITSEQEDSKAVTLMDTLFEEGILPTYSFPRDVVHFWAEEKDGRLAESPERSIDIAISEYAPGRSLVINKKTYISGGIFDYYTKSHYKKNAAEPWFRQNTNVKSLRLCANKHCEWFSTESDDLVCPLCGGGVESRQMLKPWGFAASEGQNVPETHDTQDYSSATQPSYASYPENRETMISVYSSGIIRMERRENQKMVVINKGPENKGFDVCTVCGAADPAILSDKEKDKKLRPYRIRFAKGDNQRCGNGHKRENMVLGTDFRTDLLVLEIAFDKHVVNCGDYRIWLTPALISFSEALLLASSRVMDVEFSDLKGGYRIRQSNGNIFADVYIYDSLSSGAGYANHIYDIIEEVFSRMEEDLLNCACRSACQKCLKHFWNQRMHSSLDRHLALQLINYIKHGTVERLSEDPVIKKCMDRLRRISELHGDEILQDRTGYYYKTAGLKKQVIIYSAMRNPDSLGIKDSILIPDRLCLKALPEAWEELERHGVHR